MGGWSSNGGTDDRYGEGFRPSALAKAFGKNSYDSQNLGHFYKKLQLVLCPVKPQADTMKWPKPLQLDALLPKLKRQFLWGEIRLLQELIIRSSSSVIEVCESIFLSSTRVAPKGRRSEFGVMPALIAVITPTASQ
jgi:hypothetical protein